MSPSAKFENLSLRKRDFVGKSRRKRLRSGMLLISRRSGKLDRHQIAPIGANMRVAWMLHLSGLRSILLVVHVLTFTYLLHFGIAERA